MPCGKGVSCTYVEEVRSGAGRFRSVFCFLLFGDRYEVVCREFVLECYGRDVKARFEAFGKVVSIRIVTDPYTGRSKGFGFVEMESETEGDEAIRQLNDSPFLNRPLRVSGALVKSRAAVLVRVVGVPAAGGYGQHAAAKGVLPVVPTLKRLNKKSSPF